MKGIRSLLIELYDTPKQVGSLAAKSAVPTGDLALSGSASDAVDSLLSEARKRRRMLALLTNVQQDYGEDRPEIEFYVGKAIEFIPAAGQTVFSGLHSYRNQKNPALENRAFERGRTAPKSLEDDSFQLADDTIEGLNSALDSLQAHLDLLRESHRIYGIATDLSRQSRRLEQVTDLPPGTTAIPLRAYRDTLDAAIDGQAELEKLDLEELLARISSPLIPSALCAQYKQDLEANRIRIERLKHAENNAQSANELASDSAYGSKALRIFWDGFLQQLYLRFADRLREMREALAALPW